MKAISQLIGYVMSGISFNQYYSNLNAALKKLNDEYTMLHYPLYVSDQDSLKNLTDYCINQLGPLEDKSVLEIGCGNGVQAKYIQEKFRPLHVTGIDLAEDNINIANSEKKRRQLNNIDFHVNNAQNITSIGDNSIDVVINIESAFHYPDKSAFLNEIFRVLKPGGLFLIADILTIRNKGRGIRRLWKRGMVLNHWHKHHYDSALQIANLDVTHSEDITKQVIKGFGLYKKWIRQIPKEQIIQDMILKLYYRINVLWYIFLLSHRRQYYVYVGTKPSNQ